MALNDVKEITIPVPELSDYTRLDYIECNGAQSINTNFYVKPNSTVEITFQLTDLTVAQQRLFGVRSSTSLVYDSYINGAGKFAYAYKDLAGNWQGTTFTADTNKHTIIMNGKDLFYNIDMIYALPLAGDPTNTSVIPLRLTGEAYDDVTIGGFAYLKLYQCKIYDNGVLIRNYIPVKRNSDNIAGLYDALNEIFYKSETTTEYISGNEISTISVDLINDSNNIIWRSYNASPFRKLNYLDLTNGYWRDTSRTFDGTWGGKIRYSFPTYVAQEAIAGTVSNTSTNGFVMYVANGNYIGARLASRSTTYTTNTVQDIDYAISYINWTKKIRTRMYKNNTTIEIKDTAAANYTTNTNQPNLMIHAYATSSNVIGGVTGTLRLYDYLSWETTNEDSGYYIFIPVQRKSDNVVGLFDTKHKLFIPAINQTPVNISVADEYWDLTI